MGRTPEEQAEYLARQRAEMLSPDNKWFAGLAVNHESSPQEAALHYIKHGGAENFARRWQERKTS